DLARSKEAPWCGEPSSKPWNTHATTCSPPPSEERGARPVHRSARDPASSPAGAWTRSSPRPCLSLSLLRGEGIEDQLEVVTMLITQMGGEVETQPVGEAGSLVGDLPSEHPPLRYLALVVAEQRLVDRTSEPVLPLLGLQHELIDVTEGLVLVEQLVHPLHGLLGVVEQQVVPGDVDLHGAGLHTGLHLIRGQAGGGLASFVLLVLPNLPVLRKDQGHHTVLVPDEPFRGALGGHVRSPRARRAR